MASIELEVPPEDNAREPWASSAGSWLSYWRQPLAAGDGDDDCVQHFAVRGSRVSIPSCFSDDAVNRLRRSLGDVEAWRSDSSVAATRLEAPLHSCQFRECDAPCTPVLRLHVPAVDDLLAHPFSVEANKPANVNILRWVHEAHHAVIGRLVCRAYFCAFGHSASVTVLGPRDMKQFAVDCGIVQAGCTLSLLSIMVTTLAKPQLGLGLSAFTLACYFAAEMIAPRGVQSAHDAMWHLCANFLAPYVESRLPPALDPDVDPIHCNPRLRSLVDDNRAALERIADLSHDAGSHHGCSSLKMFQRIALAMELRRASGEDAARVAKATSLWCQDDPGKLAANAAGVALDDEAHQSSSGESDPGEDPAETGKTNAFGFALPSSSALRPSMAEAATKAIGLQRRSRVKDAKVPVAAAKHATPQSAMRGCVGFGGAPPGTGSVLLEATESPFLLTRSEFVRALVRLALLDAQSPSRRPVWDEAAQADALAAFLRNAFSVYYAAVLNDELSLHLDTLSSWAELCFLGGSGAPQLTRVLQQGNMTPDPNDASIVLPVPGGQLAIVADCDERPELYVSIHRATSAVASPATAMERDPWTSMAPGGPRRCTRSFDVHLPALSDVLLSIADCRRRHGRNELPSDEMHHGTGHQLARAYSERGKFTAAFAADAPGLRAVDRKTGLLPLRIAVDARANEDVSGQWLVASSLSFPVEIALSVGGVEYFPQGRPPFAHTGHPGSALSRMPSTSADYAFRYTVASDSMPASKPLRDALHAVFRLAATASGIAGPGRTLRLLRAAWLACSGMLKAAVHQTVQGLLAAPSPLGETSTTGSHIDPVLRLLFHAGALIVDADESAVFVKHAQVFSDGQSGAARPARSKGMSEVAFLAATLQWFLLTDYKARVAARAVTPQDTAVSLLRDAAVFSPLHVVCARLTAALTAVADALVADVSDRAGQASVANALGESVFADSSLGASGALLSAPSPTSRRRSYGAAVRDVFTEMRDTSAASTKAKSSALAAQLLSPSASQRKAATAAPRTLAEHLRSQGSFGDVASAFGDIDAFTVEETGDSETAGQLTAAARLRSEMELASGRSCTRVFVVLTSLGPLGELHVAHQPTFPQSTVTSSKFVAYQNGSHATGQARVAATKLTDAINDAIATSVNDRDVLHRLLRCGKPESGTRMHFATVRPSPRFTQLKRAWVVVPMPKAADTSAPQSGKGSWARANTDRAVAVVVDAPGQFSTLMWHPPAGALEAAFSLTVYSTAIRDGADALKLRDDNHRPDQRTGHGVKKPHILAPRKPAETTRGSWRRFKERQPKRVLVAPADASPDARAVGEAEAEDFATLAAAFDVHRQDRDPSRLLKNLELQGFACTLMFPA